MLEKIKKFIEEYNLIEKGDHIIVGVSGGADSLCLLKVLMCLKDNMELGITVVHVDHGIRGEEALRDKKFVEKLCCDKGLPFMCYFYDIPRIAAEEGLTEEEAGRKYRYIAFNDALAKCNGNKIAVGHNKNDNAETMLQRLIRGTGLKGLCGIEPVRGNIIRPLLCMTRAEIEAFVGDEKYVTDSTNLTEDYTRNKIRLAIIKELEAINPAAVEMLFKTSRILSSENAYIEKAAQKALEKALVQRDKYRISLDCKSVTAEDDAVVSRLLRNAALPFTKKSQDIEYKHINNMKELAFGANGRHIDLIEGIKAAKEYDILYIGFLKDTEEFCYTVLPEQKIYIKEAGLHILLSRSPEHGSFLGVLDESRLKPPFSVRTKRNGDKLAIKHGRQPIKKIYAENKTASEERHFYPLLTDSENVLAVIGLKKGYDFFDENSAKPLYVYVCRDET